MEETEDNLCFAGRRLKVCVDVAALGVGKHSVRVLYFALFRSQMRSSFMVHMLILCFSTYLCFSYL